MHPGATQPLERGTVPVSFGAMGFHADVVVQKRAAYDNSKIAARQAKAAAPDSAPNTGNTRASVSSSKTSSGSSGHQHVAGPAQTAAAAPGPTLALPPTATASPSQAIVVADVKFASSKAREQSQLLGKGFISQQIDFEAIADSSVGGNGLPRPYGRFIAHREGNGLSMWERRPNARSDPAAQHVGPPPVSQPQPADRNVTLANIKNKQYGARSLKIEQPFKSTAMVQKDVITNLPKELLDTDPAARARPFNPPLGRDYYANRSFNRDEGRYNLPAASFLCKRPANAPTNVRVDCGQESVHDHLMSQLPRPGLEWHHSSDEANAPLYRGKVIRANGSMEPMRRPPANRDKIIHPALVEISQLRLQGGGVMPAIPSAAPRPPQEAGGGAGATFITQ
eukprot:jgi/Tetstr1/427026/TSEL_017231.t1